VTIDNVGRVGIGKPPVSPYNLDISGDTRITNQGTGANAKLDLTSDSGGTLSIRRTVGANSNADIINTGTGVLGFGTNNTSGRMIIDASGRVGINTTSPNYNLDVSGTIMARESIYVGGDPGKDGAQIFMSGGPGDADYNNTVIESRKYAGTEDTELLLFKGNDPDTGPGPDRIRLRAGQICFDTYPGDTSSRTAENIRMVIDSNGYVGVGTTTPFTFLTLQGSSSGSAFTPGNRFGDVTNNGQFFIQDGTTSARRLAMGYSAADNIAIIQSIESGTTVRPLAINPAGNTVIGVNTCNLSYTLQTGDTYLTTGGNSTDAGGTLAFGISDFPTYSPMSQIKGVLTNATGSETQGGIAFSTRPNGGAGQVMTERMRINSAGNVGIGVTPSYKLDVDGKIRIQNSDVNRLIFGTGSVDADNNNNKISLYGGDSTTTFSGFGISGQQLRYNVSDSTNDHVFYEGNTNELMRIKGTGNVGIGCNAPSVKLDVNGATKITGNLNVTGTILATGDITAFSDVRVKENINPIVNALEKILNLRGVSYTPIDSSVKKIGVIAQEIEKILPEVVLTDDSADHYKSVAYGNIVALLIEGIKELAAKVDALETK
jgi:hypothetical protein